MSNSLSSLIDFTEMRPVLASPMSLTLKLFTQNLYLSDLIMPKPVFLTTVQEAHKEYNSLIVQDTGGMQYAVGMQYTVMQYAVGT